MPNVSPRHAPRPTPSFPRLPAILGTVIVILLTWDFIAIVSTNGMTTPPLSSPKFSSIHLPTMSSTRIVDRKDTKEDNDNNAPPDDTPPAPSGDDEFGDEYAITLVTTYAARDPEWKSYSKKVQGCLATQIVINKAVDYEDMVQRCKDYYDE